MILALAFLLQAAPGPWEKYQTTPPERLGPGPHTLVITDRDAMTRIDYKTGAACQRARDEVRRQVEPPPNTAGVIYGRPSTKAFCVPR